MGKEVNKEYHILETKSVVYTYKVYAKTKKEALAKYKEHDDIEEIGLDPGPGRSYLDVEEKDEVIYLCAVCDSEFNPSKISDHLCEDCKK